MQSLGINFVDVREQINAAKTNSLIMTDISNSTPSVDDVETSEKIEYRDKLISEYASLSDERDKLLEQLCILDQRIQKKSTEIRNVSEEIAHGRK